MIVSKFDESVVSKCMMCDENKDIMHIFCKCKTVVPFWNMLENWVKSNLVENIIIDNRMRLLGCLKADVPKHVYFVIDYTLLQARIYVHKCHIKKENVYFSQFLRILRKNIEIERSFFNAYSKKIQRVSNASCPVVMSQSIFV